ncbi:MAG TPA: hypothetical protein VFM96_13315 [Gaiellaceae bacterium]|nr:hypothetical protein [Gaiellaceae bacterium]
MRERWEAAGRPYCAHERYDIEYCLGADTGDFACLNCGASWGRRSPKPPPEGVSTDSPDEAS